MEFLLCSSLSGFGWLLPVACERMENSGRAVLIDIDCYSLSVFFIFYGRRMDENSTINLFKYHLTTTKNTLHVNRLL